MIVCIKSKLNKSFLYLIIVFFLSISANRYIYSARVWNIVHQWRKYAKKANGCNGKECNEIGGFFRR